MPYYEDDDDDFLPRLSKGRPHSGLGVASFVVAVFAGVLFVSMIIIASVAKSNQQGQPDPTEVLAACGMMFAVLLALVGFGLGIAACCQSDCKLVFGILGLALSGVLGLGVLAILVISIVAR